ncbi:MAG: hypothetical protein IJW74_02150, partial [Oscillospiraceae bacterium]|nr:hypothetical protein [Oscillospiraceae bacterium]
SVPLLPHPTAEKLSARATVKAKNFFICYAPLKRYKDCLKLSLMYLTIILSFFCILYLWEQISIFRRGKA